jgi:hypothetical protein
MKSIKEKGILDFSSLHGFDVQPKRPFGSLMTANYDVWVKEQEVIINIHVKQDVVQKRNKLITHFYFDAIILYGDMTKENGLRIDADTSPFYPYENTPAVDCKLSVSLPARKLPWMVLLKVTCQELNRQSVHPRHFGMKVVAVGGG